VVWVSAVTEVIVTALFVLTVWLFVSARGIRDVRYAASLITCAACLLTHESGVAVLPVLVVAVWLLPSCGWRRFGIGRVALALVPFALMLLAYGLVAYAVNSRNYVVTEDRYAFGWHILTNMVGALVSFVVGRREALGLVVTAACIVWAATAAPPRMKFAALWTLAALLPFALFRGGLPSRYLYLPAAGFSVLLAEALWWGRGAVGRRWGRVAVGAFWVVTLLVTVRFGSFAVKNVRGMRSFGVAFREYASTVRQRYPSPARGARLEVPVPPVGVSPVYVQPLLQWEYDDPTLTTVVRDR